MRFGRCAPKDFDAFLLVHNMRTAILVRTASQRTVLVRWTFYILLQVAAVRLIRVATK